MGSLCRHVSALSVPCALGLRCRYQSQNKEPSGALRGSICLAVPRVDCGDFSNLLNTAAVLSSLYIIRFTDPSQQNIED